MNLKATVMALGLAVVGLAGCETANDGYYDGPRVYRSEPDYRYSERRIPPPYYGDARRDRYYDGDRYDRPRRDRYDGGGRGRYDDGDDRRDDRRDGRRDDDRRGDGRRDDGRRDDGDRNRPDRPGRDTVAQPPRQTPPRQADSGQNRPPREYTPPVRTIPSAPGYPGGKPPSKGDDDNAPCRTIVGQPKSKSCR